MNSPTPLCALLAWLFAGATLVMPWDPRVPVPVPVPGHGRELGSAVQSAGAVPLLVLTWIDHAHAWWQRRSASMLDQGPILRGAP